MKQELIMLNEMDANLTWFKQHLQRLKEKFDGMFIAIKEEEVISSNKDFDKLIINIKNMNENPATVMIQFISKIPVIL